MSGTTPYARPLKPAGGIEAVWLIPASDIVSATYGDGCCTGLTLRAGASADQWPILEQSSSFREENLNPDGPPRFRHTLTLVADPEESGTASVNDSSHGSRPKARSPASKPHRASSCWREGRKIRSRATPAAHGDPVRIPNEIRRTSRPRPDAGRRGYGPGTAHPGTITDRGCPATRPAASVFKPIPMNTKQKLKKTALVKAVRRDDPYLTLGAARVESDKFWRWGDDNLFPAALALMSRRSTTHRRIINDKADYISGKGFTFDPEVPLLGAFVAQVNGSGESLRQVCSKLSFDKSLFGNAFLEVVTDEKHSFLALYHQDASRCRVAKDSRHILLHHDWSRFSAADARTLPLYPLFERQDDGTLRAIVHYKDYEPMFEHYGVPPYIAGFGVSAIAYKTDRWNISRLDNSFQLSGVMMLDSTMDDEAQAERIMRTAEEKFAGNPGQVMFVLREGAAEDHSRFIPIASQNEGDWRSLHEQATSDIVVAHSWFRTLSGLDYASGFSAERILHEYEIALNTVILGEQAELLEPIREIIGRILGADPSSLEIVNRPPTRSKPLYMKVWEARKADGLDYDPEDERQQHFLAEITKYNLRSID